MKNLRTDWWIYIILFIVSQITAIVLAFAFSLIKNHQVGMSGEYMVTALFLANVLAILLFFLFRPHNITWASTVAGLRGSMGRRTLLAFLLALPLIILTNLIQEAFLPDLPNLLSDQDMETIMYNPFGLITVAVLGPLSEELLFRGGVMNGLLRKYAHQGVAVSIGLSAAIFSLVHLNPAQMVVALVLGIMLGFAYWWTGSLAAPVCIHVFNNSFACLLGFLSPDDDSLIHFVGGPVGAGLLGLVSLFFLYVGILAVRKEGLKGTEKA